MGMQVDGSVAVVTGAGGGIGAGLPGHWWPVGRRWCSPTSTRTASAKSRASLPSDSAVFASGDAGSVEHIDDGGPACREHLPGLSTYFANAGIGGGPGLQATEEQGRRVQCQRDGACAGAKRLVPDGSNGATAISSAPRRRPDCSLSLVVDVRGHQSTRRSDSPNGQCHLRNPRREGELPVPDGRRHEPVAAQ